MSDQDEYDVRVYNTEPDRRLVAAIELVSRSNKDRPESRRLFVSKLAALLQNDVCVSILDRVTVRQSNLYADLLELIGGTDPQLDPTPPDLYAATIRTRKQTETRSLLDAWFYSMALGQSLPALAIWLGTDLHIMLPLEPSYEETCRLLHIS